MGSAKPTAPLEAAVLAASAARTNGDRPHRSSGAGFLLTDLNFNVVYANSEALQILNHPRAVERDARIVRERMRTIFSADRFIAGLRPAALTSGKRRYVCRPFLLDASDGAEMVALLLERNVREPAQLGSIGERYHLSPREVETVRYLMMGLTTKEVAERMGISPNTIKQFVRLVMSKMGVTTRSGIVGKLIDQ